MLAESLGMGGDESEISKVLASLLVENTCTEANPSRTTTTSPPKIWPRILTKGRIAVVWLRLVLPLDRANDLLDDPAAVKKGFPRRATASELSGSRVVPLPCRKFYSYAP